MREMKEIGEMREMGEIRRMGEIREKIYLNFPYLPHLPHLHSRQKDQLLMTTPQSSPPSSPSPPSLKAKRPTTYDLHPLRGDALPLAPTPDALAPFW